jgi:hypothetical protein
MNKILDAEDILNDARNCVECIYMAAMDLPREAIDPIQVVVDIASRKIAEAIALLDEYRHADGAGQVPAAPDASPKSPPRRKGKGK